LVVAGRGYIISFPPDRVDRALASIAQIPEQAQMVPAVGGRLEFSPLVIDELFWPASFVRDVMSARKGEAR
jgi:hypothetical protein